MAMMGMDPDVVESIGGNLQTQAQTLQTVITSVDTLIAQLEGAWKGTDSDNFRDHWTSTFKTQLTTMQTQLNDLGTKAKNEAQQQRSTSQG